MKLNYSKPYKDEMRDKVRNLIQKKMKIKEISFRLGISYRTIMRWKQIEKKEGRLYAKRNYQRGKKSFLNHKIIFHIIKNNPFMKQEQIAKSYFILTGQKISQSSVSKYLKKLFDYNIS
jgi:transposase